MNLILPTYSIFLLIILNFVFFTKKRLRSDETKTYSILIILSTFNIIFNTIGISLGYFDGVSDFLYALNHFDLPLYFWWSSMMYVYLLYVYMNTGQKRKSYFKIKKIILILNIFITILTIFLPFEIVITKKAGYAIGPCVNLVYLVSGIYLVLSFITSIMLIIKKQFRKIIPLFSLIILGMIAAIIQKNVPSLIIIPSVAVLVEFIMYFTIENPDLKMVNELLRNKELVEKGMEDKSRFLFEVTGDIKKPTKNIISLSNNYNKFNEEEKEKAIKIIKSNANSILFKLNKELDISSLDASKIKVFNDEYDVYILFKSIQEITENLIKSKNVDLKFYVDKNLPTKLYGDEVRLKQIIMSVLSNSVQNTNKGFISVDVSAIVRYDVARLIIKIEDSGCGMSIDKINTILDDNRDLTKEETQKLDKLDMDLVATIKSVKLLGGSFNVRSEENKGSTFTIVIDQNCNTKQETKLMKSAMKYSSDVFGKKRILIVDDDKEELFKISNILSKYNVDINTTLSGKDCILRVQAGEIYNLIIIDDELKNESALGTLEELTKIKNFNSKVIVLLSKNKEHLKKYYIKDGFTDVILKENLTDELKEKAELNL